jgi:hypothetical protein
MTFGSLSGELDYVKRWLTRGLDLEVNVQGGSLLGDPPTQAHYFLGGRNTVPGYEFRSRDGDRYWLIRADWSIEILQPLLRLRAFGAAAELRGGELRDPVSSTVDRKGVASFLSVGLGLGIGWDVLRLDLARGLRDGGEWQLILSVNPAFWPWL